MSFDTRINMKVVVMSVVLIGTWSKTLDHFSSKTVYDAARGDVTSVERVSGHVGRCTPTRLYHVLRHGSRNFGRNITERMLRFLDRLETLNGDPSILSEEFKGWYGGWQRGMYYPDYELVPEGMFEHFSIAKRFKVAFPELYPPVYSVQNFTVQTTTKMRTVQSALSYLEGLYEGSGPLKSTASRLNLSWTGYQPPGLYMKNNDEDTLLRFVDTCPRYDTYVNSLAWNTESRLFEQTPEFLKVRDNVASYFNISLSLEDFKAVYYLCAAELMSPSQARNSNFCAALSPSDRSVLDYWKDLDKYHKYSYGFSVTYKMSCTLLADIIRELKQQGVTSPVLKFAHEETLYPLLTLLDLFKDPIPLTHDTPDYINRKAKVSHISPFAGNAAFIRYDCPGETEPRIQVLVNERRTTNTWCKEGSTCTLSELETILKARSDNCNLDDFCGTTEADGNRSGSLPYVVATLLAICITQATYIFFHCVKRCPFRVRGNVSADAGDRVLLNSLTSDDTSEGAT